MYYKATLLFLFYFSSILFAQISGIVSDESNGMPLQSVNISAGENGTSTNELGEFHLDVPIGTTLEFSHIGFKSIKQSAQNGMTIYMIPNVIKSDEIFVHAGLTDESLQKVTASVTVFTSDDIRESAADHFQTLTDFIPNLNWAGGTSRPRYFQIRGIGERSHYYGEGAPNFSVGFVMDDMDLSGLGMVGLLYDIDQIEVFKGPQSSVYGANALAGLISLRSTDPTDHFEMKSSTSYGTDNLYGGSSVINLRLMKGLNMRLTGIYNYSDGFRENTSQKVTNSNKRDEAISRIKLSYKPTDRLSMMATLIYSEFENGYDTWAPDNNKDFKTYSNDKGEDSQQTYGYSIRGAMDISDEITITSITSFTETNLIHAYDGDWADSSYWHDNHGFDPAVEYWSYEFYDKNEKNRANLTQEIRTSIGPFILGGYFKNLKEQDAATGYLFGGVATKAHSNFDFQAMAGYAKFGIDISSSLNLNANIRLEKNEYEYMGNSQGSADVSLPSVSYKTNGSMLGYRTSLQYIRDEFTHFYVSISQGYKSGGVNQQPYLSDASRPYEPEFIQNYEFGLKRATEKYRTQSSAFFATRKDQQVSVSSQQVQGDPNSFLFYTRNAGSGTLQGFEWEYHQTISSEFYLNASLGYLKTWVDKFTYMASDGVEENGGDRDAAMSPELTGALGVDYENEMGLFASINTSFKSEYYFSDSHDQKSDPYSLLNMTLGKSFGKNRITLWARNVMDERYTTRGFYFGLIPPDYPKQLWKSYGDPRQIGLTWDYTL